MKNFIEVTDLKTIENPVIIDVRTIPGEPDKGYEEYINGHLKDAYYMDLEKDLSSQPVPGSGNHPFPEPEKFRKKLESFGADNDSTFIIYDNGDNYSAGRLWFLLKYFGLQNIFVINGGMKSIMAEGIPLTGNIPDSKKGNLKFKEHPEMLAEYEEVEEFSKNPESTKALIDARSRERYLGNEENLYAKAGHIPGAESYFFGDNYGEDGKLKSSEFLKERFENLEGRDIIVSCGSGVTACGNIIAMDEVGLNPRLFIGSYSQWLNRGNDVSTEDETQGMRK